MTHLFKLKKDGKTVGYLRFAKYRPQFNNDLCVQSKCLICNGAEWDEGDTLDYDSIYPFVCPDKNGKEVFAGDRVKWRPEELDELCEDEFLTATIEGGFLVFDVEGTDFVEASHFKDIELIEEENA